MIEPEPFLSFTAGEDVRLSGPDKMTANVTFGFLNDESSPFDITCPCDGVVEGAETCSLRITNISVQAFSRVIAEPGIDAKLAIEDCEGESKPFYYVAIYLCTLEWNRQWAI